MSIVLLVGILYKEASAVNEPTSFLKMMRDVVINNITETLTLHIFREMSPMR